MIVNNQLIKQNLKDFDKNYDYILHEDSKRKSYCSNQLNDNVHLKQMKLFLSQLNFLNHYYDPNETNDIVYVGAAGGSHIITLSEMFPDLNFHLFDTEPFYKELNEIPTVYIHNRYFGDYDEEEWKSKPCLFISDIRDLKYDPNETKIQNKLKNEEYVSNDMIIQQGWVKNIKPIHSLLKFKLPSSSEHSSDVKEYLDGTIYLEPFSNTESMETKLCISRENLYTKNWDLVDYEEKLCHHNFEVRSNHKYKNPLSNHTMIFEKYGLMNDYDSLYLTNVVMDYLDKINMDKSEENVKNMIEYIMKNIKLSAEIKHLKSNKL
tara:strand:- start:1685 stop:2644 length:960 start_codon:yes stop_codon:yes gene_type:complete